MKLIEPMGNDLESNFLHKFLNKRGPGTQLTKLKNTC